MRSKSGNLTSGQIASQLQSPDVAHDPRMDALKREIDLNTPHGFSKAFFSGALATIQKKLGLVVSFVQGAAGPRTSSPQPV